MTPLLGATAEHDINPDGSDTYGKNLKVLREQAGPLLYRKVV